VELREGSKSFLFGLKKIKNILKRELEFLFIKWEIIQLSINRKSTYEK
jgi:hypothetical protein